MLESGLLLHVSVAEEQVPALATGGSPLSSRSQASWASTAA